MNIRSLSVFMCLFLVAGAAYAQQNQQNQQTSEEKTLQQVLQVLSSDAAKSYVAPIVSGFGSDLNGGWFHRAPTASIFGFDLEFGVVAMGTIFNDENKKFNSSGVFQFDSTQADFLISKMNDPNYNSLPPTQKEQARRDLINQIRGKDFSVAVAGPTVIGDERDSMKVRFQGGQFTINLPGGGTQTVNIPATSVTLPVTGLLGDKKILGKNMVPLATPQLTFGTIAGTQVTIRYLPEIEINSEMGKVKYFGFGIQHNPGVWFAGELPLDVSASYFTQKLEAGNVFEAKTTAFGVNASKRLGWGFLNLTPYVGYMLEKSTLTFTYDYMLDTQAGKIPQKIVFELEGENKSRLTLGLSIKVLVVNVNADYNIGKFNSFTAGVMIII